MMKSIHMLGLIAAATAALALPAQAYYNVWEADDIHGLRAANVLEQIEARGIQVERLEEWGQLVVAQVINEDGSTSFQYFDPDNNLTRVGGPTS